MKTNTKKGTIIIVSTMFLFLFFGQPIVYAGTNTWGGTQEGNTADGDYTISQQVYEKAKQLNFTVVSGRDDTNIKGWDISLDRFAQSESDWKGTSTTRVWVGAWGENVSENEKVHVEVDLWLEGGCGNSMGLKHVTWTEAGNSPQAKAMPDHYWWVNFPDAILGQPGNYTHRFNITNLDTVYNLTVSGLTFLSTMTHYANLSEIIFTGPVYANFTLSSENSWTTDIITIGDFIGEYIYFKYDISNLDGSKVVCNARGGHRVTSPPVGGVWVPVDKLGLLAPYIGLVSTILVATAATAIYVKRKKKRQ